MSIDLRACMERAHTYPVSETQRRRSWGCQGLHTAGSQTHEHSEKVPALDCQVLQLGGLVLVGSEAWVGRVEVFMQVSGRF